MTPFKCEEGAPLVLYSKSCLSFLYPFAWEPRTYMPYFEAGSSISSTITSWMVPLEFLADFHVSWGRSPSTKESHSDSAPVQGSQRWLEFCPSMTDSGNGNWLPRDISLPPMTHHRWCKATDSSILAFFQDTVVHLCPL